MREKTGKYFYRISTDTRARARRVWQTCCKTDVECECLPLEPRGESSGGKCNQLPYKFDEPLLIHSHVLSVRAGRHTQSRAACRLLQGGRLGSEERVCVGGLCIAGFPAKVQTWSNYSVRRSTCPVVAHIRIADRIVGDGSRIGNERNQY